MGINSTDVRCQGLWGLEPQVKLIQDSFKEKTINEFGEAKLLQTENCNGYIL